MRSLFAEVDRVVAVCQWVKDVLIRNGVAPEKITLCRQGIMEAAEAGPQRLERAKAKRGSSLQIAYFGRLDPTKEVQILIRALRSLPRVELRLAIYGVVPDHIGRSYERELRRLAGADERIEFHPSVPNTAIVSTLRNYDLLGVPSQCLETGRSSYLLMAHSTMRPFSTVKSSPGFK